MEDYRIKEKCGVITIEHKYSITLFFKKEYFWGECDSRGETTTNKIKEYKSINEAKEALKLFKKGAIYYYE